LKDQTSDERFYLVYYKSEGQIIEVKEIFRVKSKIKFLV